MKEIKTFSSQGSHGNHNGSKSSCPETIGVASLSLDSKPGGSQLNRHHHHHHHKQQQQQQQLTPGIPSVAAVQSGLPPYLQNSRFSSIMTASPDTTAAMSPGLSSVATSTTSGDHDEVSQFYLAIKKEGTCA